MSQNSHSNKPELPLEDSPHLLDNHGPVFLLGSPRSGTTFLSSVVTSAEGVEEFVGVLAPARMMHLLAQMECTEQDTSPLVGCLRDVFWQSFLKSRFWKTERIAKILKGKMSPLQINKPYKLDGGLFCYKEPFLCLAVQPFAREFVNGKFVHIIRDGRDVAASFLRRYPDALADYVLKDMVLAGLKNSEIGSFRVVDGWIIPWWVGFDREHEFIKASKYGRCLWLWTVLLEQALALREILPDRHYLEIRYENLAQSAELEGGRILQFIGKEPTGAFRKQMKRAYGSSVGTHGELIEAGSVSTGEIEQFAGGMLRQLGYL